jgi:catechol 2,3-dioxygenase-like lactoylglutathione lyase family enzyme
VTTTTLHEPDTASPNANDVARFVYTWFTLFEHRAHAERLTAYLGDDELSLSFPGGAPLRTVEQFSDWYGQLMANTTWNFHELSELAIQPTASGFSVGFDVDWEGAVADGSAWPSNLGGGRFRFEMHQDWQVALRPGAGADNPFAIETLVARPRSAPRPDVMNLSHDHIAIRVVDYAGTLRWYTEKLDFRVDVEWPYGDMQLAYLSNGTAKVEVLGGATAEPQPDPTSLEPTFQHEGLNHFCLAIDDFDGTLAELRTRGVELVGEPFVVEEINRELAFVKDNSGNLIELSAPRT